MLKDHLAEVARQPPTRQELTRRVRQSCRRPGFNIRSPLMSYHRVAKWGWIDPTTIARGRLGKRFSTTHHSPTGVAKMAEDILGEQGDPAGLAELFGDPRRTLPCVVVDSMAGPLGPVRAISTNGNHRTLAFEALGATIVLAEVRNYDPPYRMTFSDEHDDWQTTLDFLRWLEAHDVVRLSRDPVLRDGAWITLRIADAAAPWLAASPSEALAALDAYEGVHHEKIERIGQMDTKLLRRQWQAVAAAQVRWDPMAQSVRAPPGVGTELGRKRYFVKSGSLGGGDERPPRFDLPPQTGR